MDCYSQINMVLGHEKEKVIHCVQTVKKCQISLLHDQYSPWILGTLYNGVRAADFIGQSSR